jgi:hypothetical protein
VFRENHVTSDGEKPLASPDVEDSLSEGGSDNENSRTYYFRSSTITIGKIKEMVEKGYFPDGRGAKTVLEPEDNEAMVYEEFLSLACACLRI